jgi:XTP/dITP diphosphohydrolase
MKLVIATKNRNKIREIESILSGVDGIELVSLLSFPDAPDVVEDGDTFESNARKKSAAIAEFTGLPSMADDSGLEVFALGGRPGVLSARYGGEGLTDTDRNRLLLAELAAAGSADRSARFFCVIAISLPGGATRVAEGECRGDITDEMKGAMGFGYDPIFHVPEFGRTMAELTLEEKNGISHRGRALRRARAILLSLVRDGTL